MAPLTKDEIEAKRAAAMAAGKTAGPRPAARSGGGTPNSSRLTLARAAIRPEMKGRVMLSGPAGAGKTYTAHVIAATLVGPDGHILTIDSEKESSLTYADVFDFDQLPWNPPFDPTALSLTLKEAAAEYDCIIIDSFSHFWRKQGGVLDIAGDNVRGWKAARPIQENLIETLLDVDCHVIVCCRSKMDHLLEDKGGGKIAVTKVGMKAQQDDDLEYEVNVALEIDIQHVLHIVKSRTNAVPVGAQFLAGLAGDFAQQYREWLAAGEPVADKAQTDALRAQINGIADDGLRGRAQGAFLDTFGRPEFLLVSRLAEAQQWVAAAVRGIVPVERAEDEEPPEPSGDDGSGPAEGGPAPEATSRPAAQTAPQSAPPAPAPDTAAGNGQSGTAESTAQPDPGVQHEADRRGPDVFNGDTGHCSRCGAPVWYSAGEPGVDGVWLHAADEDEDLCPHEDDETVEPAGPGVDVDALYSETHAAPAQDLTAAARAHVEAEVKGMPLAMIARELGARGAVSSGKPAQLRHRLVEILVEEAAQANGAATT